MTDGGETVGDAAGSAGGDVRPEENETPKRPLPVAIAVVVLIVLAVFGAIEGAALLLMRYAIDRTDTAAVLTVSIAGAIGILVALLFGTLAAAVWRGSRSGRITITVLVGAALLLDIVTLWLSTDDLWWTALDAAIYAYVLCAMWIGRSTAAFFRRRPARPAADAAATAA